MKRTYQKEYFLRSTKKYPKRTMRKVFANPLIGLSPYPKRIIVVDTYLRVPSVHPHTYKLKEIFFLKWWFGRPRIFVKTVTAFVETVTAYVIFPLEQTQLTMWYINFFRGKSQQPTTDQEKNGPGSTLLI